MLPEVTRILYASDIQAGARPAFRTAVSLCGQYASEITFLHVVEPVRSNAEKLVRSMMAADHSLQDLHDNSLQHIQQQVQERVDRFCREELDAAVMLDGGKLTTCVKEGTPWKQILEVAEAINASVIVMGVRHQHSLVGSTSSKVVHHSKRPVLVVPIGLAG
jgi:nucleotide-binding universal stress UspA family protein